MTTDTYTLVLDSDEYRLLDEALLDAIRSARRSLDSMSEDLAQRGDWRAYINELWALRDRVRGMEADAVCGCGFDAAVRVCGMCDRPLSLGDDTRPLADDQLTLPLTDYRGLAVNLDELRKYPDEMLPLSDADVIDGAKLLDIPWFVRDPYQLAEDVRREVANARVSSPQIGVLGFAGLEVRTYS